LGKRRLFLSIIARGFIDDTGRVPSALALATMGFLGGNYGVASVLGMTSGFFVLAAIIVFLFLRETKGLELQ
jgi:hypothetical protein